MRINLKKYLFVGARCLKEDFLILCQNEGVIEFIGNKFAFVSSFKNVHLLTSAIKILHNVNRLEYEHNPSFLNQSIIDLADYVVSLQESISKKNAIAIELEEQEKIMSPFGLFSSDIISDIEKRTNKTVRLFYRHEKSGQDVYENIDNIFLINQVELVFYYFSVGNEDVIKDGLNVVVDNNISISDVDEAIIAINKEIKWINKELRKYTCFETNMHSALNTAFDIRAMSQAKSFCESSMENHIFFVEGWIPEDKVKEIEEKVSEIGVICEEVKIESSDRIPTCLKNKGIAASGQDLIRIYDAPSQEDKDPSGFVAWCFTLFFSIIIGDAGYGLILLLLTSMFAKKSQAYINKSPKSSMSRMLKLSKLLSLSCIAWGIFGPMSFFGWSPPADSYIKRACFVDFAVRRKAVYTMNQPKLIEDLQKSYASLSAVTKYEDVLFSVKNASNEFSVYKAFSDNVLFELALLIGVSHIIIGLLRYGISRPSGFGWALFLVGAYLFFPSYLNQISMVNYIVNVPYSLSAFIGIYVLFSGIGIAVIISMIKDKFSGISEISNVVQIFSDSLSYLRLYALALAGSMMASTFNNIGMNMNLIVGIPIILVGHCINLVLSIMGGVIHGLRLNFIEWYHYSFNGGGKLFDPLKKHI